MAAPCTEQFYQQQAEGYQTIKRLYKKERTCEGEGEGVTDSAPPHTSAPEPGEVKTLCETMIISLDEALRGVDDTDPAYFRLLGMKSSLLYEQAKLVLRLEQEEESQQLLSSAVETVVQHAGRTELSFLVLRVINHFAYVMATREALDLALAMLEQAENIYVMLRAKSVGGDSTDQPLYFTADDLFSPEVEIAAKPDTGERLERLVTNNFQMMSYIHNRQGRIEAYNVYQNRVLNRQLQMRDGDALQWAGKTTKMAHNFLERLQFRNARTYLAAASDIIQEYQDDIRKMEASEMTQERLMQMEFRFADLGRMWVKYALSLFSTSKHCLVERMFYGDPSHCDFLGNLLAHAQEDACHACATDKDEGGGEGRDSVKEGGDSAEGGGSEGGVKDKDPPPEKIGDVGGESYTFSSLDLSYIESKVQWEHVCTTEQARQLFIFTQPWLKRAMAYFNLRDYPSEYVNCVLDLSELYRYLSFYEEDTDTQYNVQKRRADTLETLSTILRESNPACYVGASVELYRELAEVQLEMMGLNLRRLCAAENDAAPPSPGADKAAPPSHDERLDWAVHKMEAVKDIQGRLQEFGTFLVEADARAAEGGEQPLLMPKTETPAARDDSSGDAAVTCKGGSGGDPHPHAETVSV